MKPWIKLETTILSDPRIQRLMDEMGVKGLGIYVIIRMMCDANEGCMYPDLCRGCGDLTSRKMLRRIIDEYDLFYEDVENPHVLRAYVCARASVRAITREPAREPVRGPVREIARAPKPTEEIEIENIDIDNIREWLMSPNNLPWREPVMMHSGYSSLLKTYWADAVEFFLQHMMAQDKLSAIYNEHEARQYFSNFSRLSIGSGLRLKEHLQERAEKALQASPSALHEQNGIQYYNGRPLPADAPSRPSDTAEWDEASGTWFELYK